MHLYNLCFLFLIHIKQKKYQLELNLTCYHHYLRSEAQQTFQTKVKWFAWCTPSMDLLQLFQEDKMPYLSSYSPQTAIIKFKRSSHHNRVKLDQALTYTDMSNTILTETVYVLDCNIVHFVQMIIVNPSDHKKGDPMRMIDKNEHTHISIRITNENHILKISTLDFGNISCNLFHIWVCL